MVFIYLIVVLLTMVLMIHVFVYVNDIEKRIKDLSQEVKQHFSHVEEAIVGKDVSDDTEGNDEQG